MAKTVEPDYADTLLKTQAEDRLATLLRQDQDKRTGMLFTWVKQGTISTKEFSRIFTRLTLEASHVKA